MVLNPHISETQWVWITTYQNHKSDFHSLWSESLLARANQSLPHLSKRKHKYVFESCVRNCWWHHCKLTSLQAKCCKEQRVFTAWRWHIFVDMAWLRAWNEMAWRMAWNEMAWRMAWIETSIFQPIHSLMQIEVHCDLFNMFAHHTSPITLMMDPGQALKDVRIRAVYHKAVTGFCITIWIGIQWRPLWI